MPKVFDLLSSDVEEYVLQYIDEHELKEGDHLPTERALSEELGITRSSLRGGLQALVDQGVIYRKHGSGSYLCPAKTIRTLAAYCFPNADKALDRKAYSIRPIKELPTGFHWFLDRLLPDSGDIAQTDFFIELVNETPIAITANVQTTQALALFPNLFDMNEVPSNLIQTQIVRVFEESDESLTTLLDVQASDTLLFLQNGVHLGKRRIASSCSICVGTRVSLVSSSRLPE